MKYVKMGFGPHLIIDGYDCNKKKISDMEFIYRFLDELPDKIGMRKVGKPDVDKIFESEKDEDYGISGLVLIMESHIAIHSFPAKNCIFIDIFSCKDFDTDSTKKMIIEAFEIKKPVATLLSRGDEFPKNIKEAKAIWDNFRKDKKCLK